MTIAEEYLKDDKSVEEFIKEIWSKCYIIYEKERR